MSDAYRTTFHRNGTVTYWDIHDQRWWRVTARAITLMPRVMATLSATERARIERMAARG